MKAPQNQIVSKTFFEHVDELRYRIFVWAISLMLGSAIGYYFYDELLALAIRPLNKPLYYLSPIGGFNAVLSLSLIFGFIVSSPIFLYHLIKFIEPAVGTFTSKTILLSISVSIFLSFLGAFVAYRLILPATFDFLSSFGTSQMSALITSEDYFSFVIRYVLGFALFFQLPLLMLFIDSIYALRVKTLFKYLKYVVVLSFIIAAILTPTPDFINQSLMAFPILGLYLGSMLIIFVRSLIRRKTTCL